MSSVRNLLAICATSSFLAFARAEAFENSRMTSPLSRSHKR